MRAMATDRVGAGATLRPHTLPMREPGAGEVLIKVMATAVSPADLGMLAGRYRWYDELRLPLVPGYDVAGVVEAGDWERGAAVIASTGHSRTQVGSYAEYVTLPASYVAPKPANLDWAEAATLPLAALTAHQALELLDLHPGQSLLVNAPRGAVGRFTTQLAQAAGITVLTPDAAVVGAGGLVGGAGVPVGEAGVPVVGPGGPVVGAGGGVGWVDAALDVVGGERARRAFAAVRDGGAYVTVVPEFWVPGGQFTPERGITPQLVRAEPSGARLTAISRAAEAGQLTATVAKTLPLTEAQQALDLLASGGVRGKIVLLP
ncbi:NADP-dependent oxidoreductase [Kribbella jejuensis]|uniref:NADPH2:quinone reductase n=2 Tax=Kribbella jejuensis TaxID=236068 RepID=A0A542ER63_9ACTN|nr:NADPH2:quinone reductase [Kribbella jejuensis]